MNNFLMEYIIPPFLVILIIFSMFMMCLIISDLINASGSTECNSSIIEEAN